jgi:hypothetical protein
VFSEENTITSLQVASYGNFRIERYHNIEKFCPYARNLYYGVSIVKTDCFMLLREIIDLILKNLWNINTLGKMRKFTVKEVRAYSTYLKAYIRLCD